MIFHAFNPSGQPYAEAFFHLVLISRRYLHVQKALSQTSRCAEFYTLLEIQSEFPRYNMKFRGKRDTTKIFHIV